MDLKVIKEKVIQGYLISKNEALEIYEYKDLNQLLEFADKIRTYFCGNGFDICTIINAKSGRCSENCKFCAQSSFYKTEIESYPLLDKDKTVKQAVYNEKEGILRYSIVTSGKKLSDLEVDRMCETLKEIQLHSNISLCGSFGLLSFENYKKLKEAGLSRIHNNLESSRNFFKNICTTHTYDEKVEAIKSAVNAGLTVCSGGIIGLGESVEDRIDMAIDLRNLGVKSIPINILNPIPGTPLGHNTILSEEEILRVVAVFRFINPDASIRMAGGRGLLKDKGKRCFMSGANSAISGDMLTTAGISIKNDMQIIKELGYEVVLCND